MAKQPLFDFSSLTLDYDLAEQTTKEMYSYLIHNKAIACGCQNSVSEVIEKVTPIINVMSFDKGRDFGRFKHDIKSAYNLMFSLDVNWPLFNTSVITPQ